MYTQIHINMHNFLFDFRLVETTVSLLEERECEDNEDDDGVKLVLKQVADRDERFHFDSDVTFEVYDGELVMTTTVHTDEGPVSGTRTFTRYDLDKLMDLNMNLSRRNSNCSRRNSLRKSSASPDNTRRNSVCVSPNLSRRASVNVPPQPFLRKTSLQTSNYGDFLSPAN